jgi:hypothetical protein
MHSTYRDLIDSMGVETLLQVDDNDHQGDSRVSWFAATTGTGCCSSAGYPARAATPTDRADQRPAGPRRRSND